MIDYIKELAVKMGITLTDKQLAQLVRYKELLVEWNEKINLTAITEEREVALKHFADCLSVLCVRDLSGKSVIDVGTGAGFPGLVLKIAVPDIRLTLLDSLNKRINFLETVVAELGLTDVTCIHSRAEEGGQNPDLRERFDICASRAVAQLNVLTEYDLPFVRVGGEMLALKGPAADEEIKNAERAIKALGGELAEVREVTLPDSELKHRIVIIKKCGKTAKKYPRNAGKIKSTPL
jgi:16S rRNA (guanine527-N7)-methyltransferase